VQQHIVISPIIQQYGNQN